ncbi:MAG: ABC transporter permease subunit [Lachnospiraceae bacterium]|nr:ABC transporter permease subunit [Lachnospiraceae bacterium]
MLLVLPVCLSFKASAGSSEKSDGVYENVDELAGKRIGVMTGTIHDRLVEKRLPTAQIVYFNTIADMLDALKAGKIDAMIRPQSGALFISYEEKSITWLDEHLTDADVSFAFPKTEDGAALCQSFSAYIRTLRESGELETLRGKWFGEDESVKTMIDISALPATNGTLRLAATGTQMPFNYVRDNAIVGFEIELAAHFCEMNGYALQIDQMNFDGVLASVQAEKCDFACACLAITEERKESVDFSESHFAESVVFVVLKNTAGQKDSFLDNVRASFEKTFIRENRWKLFLEGIGTTMLITVLSILFGTLLGFAVYMLCRNGNPVANALTRFFVWFVQGMPVVVLLMILYYIIFAKSSIDGTAVAVIGFTLVFGAAMFAMLRAGVGAVDKGQTEAAYALGYGNTRTFFRVILPQAIPHFLPSYKGQITSLIKATAVVGYIAVQDLTKMGDIVRGRTYEAFFPLIAVAVIYFLLAAILNFLVGRIELNVDPKRRKKENILKGVELHD